MEGILQDFGINGQIKKINNGPVVSLYEFEPAAGVKVSKIVNLSDDLARNTSSTSARVAVIPGKNTVGIEIPNENKEFELINMGILSDYRSKGYGSLLLTHVLKNSSDDNAKKVWVHTCSLDHKFALANYISRGFKVFKKEQIDFVA